MFRIPSSLPAWLVRNRTGFFLSTVSFAIVTAALLPFVHADQIIYVVPLFLLITLLSAALWGYAVGVTAAFVASLCVNFFTDPRFIWNLEHPAIIAAVVVFFAVALVGATMLGLIRRQALAIEARGSEAQILLDLSREVTTAATPAAALERICTAATTILGAESCQIISYRASAADKLPRGIVSGARERWSVIASIPRQPELPDDLFHSKDEESVAVEALRSRRTIAYNVAVPARGRQEATGQRTQAVFVPLSSGESTGGILKLVGQLRVPAFVNTEHILSAFGDEASLAVERARLADEALRAQALQKADELKSAILSGVSHDLRSPLTAIKTSVSSLRDSSINLTQEDRVAFLEIIESQTDRLTSTVDNLLQMNRLETGAVEVRLEPLDAAGLLGEVAAQSGNIANGHKVLVNAAEDLYVNADYGLMVQAIGNLVENAAKYSRPGGKIRLSAEDAAGKVVIAVMDDGPGISRDELPHLFERFYRGRTASGVRGTGLGLSIVKSMVELCGGSITVSSSPDGTAFVIALPAAEKASTNDRRAHTAG